MAIEVVKKEVVKQEYDSKNMQFRRLGNSGLRVPVFSLGGWLTIGTTVMGDSATGRIKAAFDNGINMFNNAENYNSGQSELEMGRAFKELGYRRSDLIVTTKNFFGVKPAQTREDCRVSSDIIEGTQASLERLQLSYVDVIFAHRNDPNVPMEEVVRAFNYVIEKGWAFYWGILEWSAEEVEEAFHVAAKLNLIAPIAEQCEHNMFHRERPEKEYMPLYRKYNYSTTVWSGLASGILTGKYNDGIPTGSRYDMVTRFQAETILLEQIATVRELNLLKKCKVSHLALAWLARNPKTGTVILGACSSEQLLDNLKAIDVIPKLTPEVLQRVEEILGNKPAPLPTYKHPELDPYGRA